MRQKDLAQYTRLAGRSAHTDDLSGLAAAMLQKLNERLTTQRERLQRLREQWQHSLPYVPASLAEMVRSDPSVCLDDAEKQLLDTQESEEQIRYAEDKRGPEGSESQVLLWMRQQEQGYKLQYWSVRLIVRLVGRELIRDELERFAANLEKHYVLVPRRTPEEVYAQHPESPTQEAASSETTSSPEAG